MIALHLSDGLRELLPRRLPSANPLLLALERRTSVKDFIEAHGIPHPEIDTIFINGREAGFGEVVQDGDCIALTAISAATDFFHATRLRPEPLTDLRFVADINVAKLGIKLRQLGFDTIVAHGMEDHRIAASAACQRRILLSRDRRLLQRRIIEFGHLVRSRRPFEQLVEVVRLYRLLPLMRPYSLCLRCNSPLQPVSKSEVEHRLQPLTRRYFDLFHRCPACDSLYWAGSHREAMDAEIRALVTACGNLEQDASSQVTDMR